jgi:hypothetical protein
MKKLALLIIMVCWYGLSNAQLYKIQNAQAFFTSSIPGMQRVDDNGNKVAPEPIVTRFIYVECKFNGRPKIDSVFYNGILFNASAADKEETNFKIGIKTENGKPVLLHPKKGNHIWKIDLVQADGNNLQHSVVKKITIKGKLDKTKFTTIIIAETELATPDMY